MSSNDWINTEHVILIVISSIAAFFGYNNNGKISKTDSRVAEITVLVNGRTTKLVEDLTNASAQIAKLEAHIAMTEQSQKVLDDANILKLENQIKALEQRIKDKSE